ncbi:ureidoglycolate lyase [Azorhizobium oxalatiphilum]|uniref:Ureidoglycolate lyase n=1 Tax=Azorhizobium oxalatiphilum TaxID=980631 RepID=A0A917FDQ4_9HYPH|nr:ureidoglycolate lyase [Azorhizobium oxalatiphilum]GGF73533.1 ureidoglycolate lyase [Azorhizobium oxalatiphilum]
MIIKAEKLTPEAFAPFGGVIEAPAEPGQRDYFDGQLLNLRPHAAPSISIALPPLTRLPLEVRLMERHVFSSQSFIAMAPADWLVIVAPDKDGAADMDGLRAFLPSPHQGITLAAGAWHYPLTCMTPGVGFALIMWRDGGPDDEDIRDTELRTVTL